MANGYEQIIEGKRGWQVVDWRQLAHYRDLLFLMVRRDFVAKYKQTVLGPVWFIVQPLLATLVFTIIFGGVAKIPTDGLPMQLFYLCGLLPWMYFEQTLPAVSTSLITNAQLLSKVYFPRLIVPLSMIMSGLFSFGLQLVTFLGFYYYFKYATPAGGTFHATWAVLGLPLFVLHTAAISLGFGLWLAGLTAKYRDFTHLTQFMIKLGMYAAPIIYPFSKIPEKWRLAASLNPMVSNVECFKYAFFGNSLIASEHIVVSTFVTLLVLITGLLVFGKVERTFVDIV